MTEGKGFGAKLFPRDEPRNLPSCGLVTRKVGSYTTPATWGSGVIVCTGMAQLPSRLCIERGPRLCPGSAAGAGGVPQASVGLTPPPGSSVYPQRSRLGHSPAPRAPALCPPPLPSCPHGPPGPSAGSMTHFRATSEPLDFNTNWSPRPHVCFLLTQLHNQTRNFSEPVCQVPGLLNAPDPDPQPWVHSRRDPSPPAASLSLEALGTPQPFAS